MENTTNENQGVAPRCVNCFTMYARSAPVRLKLCANGDAGGACPFYTHYDPKTKRAWLVGAMSFQQFYQRNNQGKKHP